MDKEAYSQNLAAAQGQLNAEEKAAFDQKRGAMSLEITRLLQENEKAGDVYIDAGIEKQIEELRNTPEVRLSVETFIFTVETLNSEE